MKPPFLIVFLICLNAGLSTFATGVSAVTNGIYVVVGGTTTNELIRFDESLLYMPYCNTGSVAMSLPDHRYSIRMRMFDTNNQSLKKSGLGSTYGSCFDDLHSYKDGRPGGVCACGPYRADLGPSGLALPSPNKLFVIPKPGIYTLEVEIQMFRHSASLDTNVWNKNLIRFSPVQIKVHK